MYLCYSRVERMLNLARANQFFNEFHIMDNVNIQPIFWNLLIENYYTRWWISNVS